MRTLIAFAASRFDPTFGSDLKRSLRGTLAVFICSSLLAMLVVAVMIASNLR